MTTLCRSIYYCSDKTEIMKLEASLPRSQEPSDGPYTWSQESCLFLTPTLILSKINAYTLQLFSSL